MTDKKDPDTKDPEKFSGGEQGREPQSYGSESDWLTGRTGQTVDETPERVSRHDEDFYESRSDEENPTHATQQPPADHREQARPESAKPTSESISRVSESVEGHDSYFRERDYEKDED